ncbi:MAG: hypothetical protein ACRD19_11680 [Terriglobia bacterium]
MEKIPTIEVIASLEGMKVAAHAQSSALYEYDFDENAWHEIDASSRPMSTDDASRWVQGWNPVDRLAALAVLTSPPEA